MLVDLRDAVQKDIARGATMLTLLTFDVCLHHGYLERAPCPQFGRWSEANASCTGLAKKVVSRFARPFRQSKYFRALAGRSLPISFTTEYHVNLKLLATIVGHYVLHQTEPTI
jgi:hypothetical protein